ncbi:MAG: TBC domain-containing protein [Moraxellaceae bacterium]|nr:MAG: TBC domain-containing protein [Moraxellaceae bacterium]
MAAREAVSGQRIIRLIASDAVHAAPAGSIQGSAGREAGKGLRWPAATGAYNFKTMRQRVRNALEKGYTVPHATRWYVYQHLTGGLEIEAHFPGLYKLLLQVGPAPPSADTVIRCDVHRTMPTIPFFGSRFQPGPGQSQLYRILTAYAHLDPEVCYTQGMAFIVALLLLTGMREQAAFYAFAGLMLRFGLRHFFGNGLHLTLLAHKVLTRLLEHAAPVLAAKLEEAMVLPPAYATQWLMTMFVSILLSKGWCANIRWMI